MSFAGMFGRLLRPGERSRASVTVEVFGWLIMLEGTLMLLAPAGAASILHLPTMVEQAENYFRLIGLLVGGIGMIYVVSGRMNADGFVFASMLDRPLVPLVMATLWYLKLIPWQLALAFAIQDFGSFLWTLFTWRKEQRS
jgi:uncharacterized protein YjeT (DUF2065 family)